MPFKTCTICSALFNARSKDHHICSGACRKEGNKRRAIEWCKANRERRRTTERERYKKAGHVARDRNRAWWARNGTPERLAAKAAVEAAYRARNQEKRRQTWAVYWVKRRRDKALRQLLQLQENISAEANRIGGDAGAK